MKQYIAAYWYKVEFSIVVHPWNMKIAKYDYIFCNLKSAIPRIKTLWHFDKLSQTENFEGIHAMLDLFQVFA